MSWQNFIIAITIASLFLFVKITNEKISENKSKKVLYEKLVEALWNYNLDAPHFVEAKPNYGKETYENIVEFSKEEHSGDCIGLPATCVRCVAEEIICEANYIWGKSVL